MRTAEDYKKLVEGYCFSLFQLKQVNEKIYNRFIKAIEMLNKQGCLFAELVRDLKIDFINENDARDGKSTKYIALNSGIKSEMFAMGYSPKNDFVLGLLYIKKTVFGIKKWFYEISPVTLEDAKEQNFEVDFFRISTITEEEEEGKSYVYVPRIEKDIFFIVEVDIDKPYGLKRVFYTNPVYEKDTNLENMF